MARRADDRAGRVLSHRVRRTPLGNDRDPGPRSPGRRRRGRSSSASFLPAHADWIELTTRFRLGRGRVAPGLLRRDAVRPARERRRRGPRTPRDASRSGADPRASKPIIFTAQGWVDFSTSSGVGVTVATPQNPLVQLGRLALRRRLAPVRGRPPRTCTAGVANSYWETNYPAVQPGDVTARYRVLPHAGPFDETAAHRFGLDALASIPLLHPLGEVPAPVMGPACRRAAPRPGHGAFRASARLRATRWRPLRPSCTTPPTRPRRASRPRVTRWTRVAP